MGWINESAPEHEGYLVGIVPATNADGTKSNWRWRDLSTEAGDQAEAPCTHVQMACDCGWRSRRIAAPYGTYWLPSIVIATASLEDEGYHLWREHIDSEAARRQHAPLRRSALDAR